MKNLWPVLKQTFAAWNDHDAPRQGAALAFYTILSLAPLMIFVIAIAALVFGDSSARERILGQLQGMVGTDGANAVRMMIEKSQKPAPGIFASIAGMVTLLFGASGVFGELRAALNRMWDVTPKSGSGPLDLIKERVFSFGMVVAIGFLLLVSLVLSTALAAIGKFFGGLLPVPESLLGAINFLASLIGISVLFAPDIQICSGNSSRLEGRVHRFGYHRLSFHDWEVSYRVVLG